MTEQDESTAGLSACFGDLADHGPAARLSSSSRSLSLSSHSDSGYSSLGSSSSCPSMAAVPEEPTTSLAPDKGAALPRIAEDTTGCPNSVPGRIQRPRPIPQHPAFQGWQIFDATSRQTQRFHEILDYITLPLNNCLRSRTRLSIRTTAKKVNAVRLAVSGPDQATARPHIVFFCGPNTSKAILDFLEKPAYKQFFGPREDTELSFFYKVISDGVRLRCSPRAYAEMPVDFNRATNCGTPIRLYRDVSDTGGCSTLGGVLKATLRSGSIVYYAMTAGHFLDSFPNDDWGDDVDDLEQDIHQNDSRTSMDTSHWSFSSPRTYNGIFTPCTGQGMEVDADFRYLDWALFQLDHWSLNALSRTIISGPVLLSPPEVSSKSQICGAGRQVLVITPAGVLDGWIQPEMGKTMIPPGQELTDTYIVTLTATCKSLIIFHLEIAP